MEYIYPCQRIWEGYKVYASGASVVRKGFELVGVAKITNDSLDLNSTFRRRSESILEHQAKVAWLATAFISNFPGYFGEQNNFVSPLNIWFLITTALCHDVGETASGDIPDDGNPLHDTKDGDELAVFKRFVSAYAFNERRGLVELFEAFQDKTSRPGQALYALDKLDAVLTHMVLESHGVYGLISSKKNPTERDLQCAKQVGSDAAADVWGVQMFSKLEDFPAEVVQPAFTMLSVASLDVRGEEFPWLKTHA